jgi:hypothetical protein
MPTMWGYSIGISDIRVTLADGSEHDCLQKIYPIAQSITLGRVPHPFRALCEKGG